MNIDSLLAEQIKARTIEQGNQYGWRDIRDAVEQIQSKIKDRKELYGWTDLCSSEDCVQVMIDGDKWCAFIGENIHEGWAGFGDTRSEAKVDLYKEMLKE